ncbi:MAG TPA: hypothetical protein VGN60_12685 [Devosia sp.]|jgi:hypothetical protein|nr:hypothetical protein [Devosia sp.]
MAETERPEAVRPETDKIITELNQGKAERVALGKNPYGSMVRIALAALLFVLIFGTIFYVANN